MSKAGEIPYTWQQIEDQIQKAILCQASILLAYGPYEDERIVRDFLGLSSSAKVDPKEMSKDEIAAIDITRHTLHAHVRVAYDYAYQRVPIDRLTAETCWHEVVGILEGFPQTDAQGEPSPLCKLNDFPLRRVLETFIARFTLFDPEINLDMTIRQLAFLSNMTVPAVRTSLSKEGFKLEKTAQTSRSRLDDVSFKLAAEDSRTWLSRRRGFIPQNSQDKAAEDHQIIEQLLTDKAANFSGLLSRLFDLRQIPMEECIEIGLDQVWVSKLLAGEDAGSDIDALRRLARALELPEPEFSAAAVLHLVRMASS
jgi:hypothetical protein